jgi:hypothetical protein
MHRGSASFRSGTASVPNRQQLDCPAAAPIILAMSRFFAANQAGTIATVGFVLALFIFVGCFKTETSSISAESPADKSSQGAANTKYELRNIIKFGAGGDSECFRTSGWSNAEGEHTWTEGNSAVLIFSCLPRSQPLTLKMTIVGLTKPPQLPAQPTEV